MHILLKKWISFFTEELPFPKRQFHCLKNRAWGFLLFTKG